MMVPHALFTFADKTGIEVALLKKPFEHHGNQVQLVFLLALEKKRNDEMNLLFQFFNQIVSHKKIICMHSFKVKIVMPSLKTYIVLNC